MYFYLLILIGIIILSIDNSKKYIRIISKGTLYAIITLFSWGTLFALFKIQVENIGPLPTLLINEFGVMVWSAIFIAYTNHKLFKPPSFKLMKSITIISLLSVAGILFYNLGISVYSMHVVAAVVFSKTLVSSLFAWMYFKERLKPMQWFGATLIIVSISCIYYFN